MKINSIPKGEYFDRNVFLFKRKLEYNSTLIPDSDCIEWTGCKDTGGYGMIYGFGSYWRAHRVSYWVNIDLCQSDLLLNSYIKILHNCDNPGCINPDHLRKGSSLDNVMDMVFKKRHFSQSKTHCPHGHEYNEENTYINKKGNRFCKACNRNRAVVLHLNVI